MNEEEIETWSFEDDSGVPSPAYQRMVREQDTAEEAIRAAQIVQPTDRGQDLPCQQSRIS